MKTVLCYGDSNTYGLKPDLRNRYERKVRWTGILQEHLGKDYYIIEEGLGGRTTVWEDPIEEYRNGKSYLIPCLDSHKPLDLVILMLGTNDLKKRFSLSSFDVASAMENLVRTILKSDAGPAFHPPAVLLTVPVPIRHVGNRDLDRMMEGGEEKSRELADYYKALAGKYEIAYLDPGELVEVSGEDGIHYTERGHAKMAALMAEKVRQILEGVDG